MDRSGIRRRSLAALVITVLVTGLVVVAAPGTAQQRDALSRSPIARSKHGFFDSRSAVGVSGKVADARLALAQTLGSQGVVDADATTGTLRFVGRLDGLLTGPSAKPAEAVALDYVREHMVAFGLSRADLRTFHLRQDYVDILGTHHLSWVQRVGGVEVFPNGLKANVTRAGRLINVSGSPAAGLRAPTASARLDATAAIAAARSAAGGAAVRRSSDQAKLVLFPTARGGRLAWRTTTWVGEDALISLIDAKRGDLLWRTNLTRFDVPGTGVAVDYFPGASVPNGGGVEHAVSFPVMNGLALSGNNAHVFAEPDADLATPGVEIPASSGVDWNYPAILDTTTAAQNCSADFPCTWNATTPFSWQLNLHHFGTQLYYFLNQFHDHLLAGPIGFTEAAGNFQVTNTSGQGQGGDPVLGAALVGASTNNGLPDEAFQNNASMATLPDGIPPLMAMFLFQGVPGFSAPSIHSGDDAAIVYHEYTHGLVARLNTFPDGTDANVGFQSGAMHEAWADWYALDFLTNDGLVIDGGAVGDVLMGPYSTAGTGIRPQAIDCTVGASAASCPDPGFGSGPGGFTYGDMGHIFFEPEVHDDGQIWAQTMWDLRRSLGSNLVGSLATRGQELAPPIPSFLDTRNAVIQADLVATGGANADTLWQLFAARGMGFFASSPDADDTTPIEDFSLPPDCSVDPCRTISGTITEKGSGNGVKNAQVFIAGHFSGFASDLADTTNNNGVYSIPNVPFHAYELVVEGVGYEQRAPRAVTVDGNETVNAKLVRDWAALEGGATLQSFTPPDYAPDCGTNADGAFDLSLSSGWPSDAPDSTAGSNKTGPRKAVVKLPKAIDVTSFGVASGGTCGDGPESGVRKFTIETKVAGGKWVIAVSGTADNDSILHTFKAKAGKQNVRFIRFTMKSTHGDNVFMDVLEVTVRGK